ncbi:MAG: hypothetical protein WAM83_21650, partial [Bradyrhizobium sp.]
MTKKLDCFVSLAMTVGSATDSLPTVIPGRALARTRNPFLQAFQRHNGFSGAQLRTIARSLCS